MNNKDIRTTIFESGLKKYEIANQLGITQYTLSHWLQSELTQERKERIYKAIKELQKH